MLVDILVCYKYIEIWLNDHLAIIISFDSIHHRIKLKQALRNLSED